MAKLLSYKAYFGSVHYSAADGRLYGKLESIPEPVTFEASSIERLREEFENAVDYYLEFCQVAGSPPKRSREVSAHCLLLTNHVVQPGDFHPRKTTSCGEECYR